MSYIRLEGDDFRIARETLASAFRPQDFKTLLGDAVGPDVLDRLDPQAHQHYVRDAVLLVNSDGCLDELLIAAAKARPGRPELVELVLRFGGRPGWQARRATQLAEAAHTLEALITRASPFIDAAAMARWLIRVERQVCQVQCGGERGSGFLVGPDLVLTCHHVVSEHLSGEVPAAQVAVRFDQREGPDGKVPDDDAPWSPIDASWTIPHAPQGLGAGELDYALLRIVTRAGDQTLDEGRPRGWIDLSAPVPIPRANGPALVVQHPGRLDGPPHQWPVRIAFATPGFVEVGPAPQRLVYRVSTRKGSSGSPVFDGKLAPVAIHHNRGATHPTDPELVIENRGVPLGLVAADLPAAVRAGLSAPPAGP